MFKRNFLLLLFVCSFIQVIFAQYQETAVRFANSEMKRFPEAWQLDHGSKFVWGYAQGVGCCAMLKVWHNTGDQKYYDYVYKWADYMVQPNGAILNYKISDYNIDFINSGKILFDVYAQSGNKKYRMAMDTLLSQLDKHPQTSDSVFWHKKIYPHQIWLDGIYMAGPYIAQYGKEYNRPDLVDKAMHELVVTYKHTLDAKTGLLYHAYDEKREQLWANKETGHSPNFWGRAMGWYFMALVDIMDFVPANHPQRTEVINIMEHLANVIPVYQDKTGLWYQVLDQGGREGNYLEASVSTMFMYSIAKAVNKGYINRKHLDTAKKAYDGLMKNLIKVEPDGTLTLTKCCAVGGLGGNPYRDGSYEYYINEKIRDNDSKATGPFIMGCLELEAADAIAFPTAEGFGKYASGGRGGEVYVVTNLNDSGAGSFRDAVSKPNRTVVFSIGGVIKLEDKVKAESNITIAGQTAPGDGITIYGHGISFSDNTIVRYIRLHGSIGMARGSCVLVADNLKNAIFDHVSVQWGRWDNLHVKNTKYITFQHCIFGEAIDPQRFGALLERPDSISIHHCLWIDNQSRNPKAKAGIQFYNNVIYNWGGSAFVGGHSSADHYQDVVNNYFIAGPNSSDNFLSMFSPTDHVYHKGNYADMNKDGVLNGRLVTDDDVIKTTATLMPAPNHGNEYLALATDAATAYKIVLEQVGYNLKRDEVDMRLINQLKSLGKEGKIIREESEVGGQPEVKSGTPLKDSDNDGMLDEWERKNGLNPNNASDAGFYTLDKKYTNIEMYINGLVNK